MLLCTMCFLLLFALSGDRLRSMGSSVAGGDNLQDSHGYNGIDDLDIGDKGHNAKVNPPFFSNVLRPRGEGGAGGLTHLPSGAVGLVSPKVAPPPKPTTDVAYTKAEDCGFQPVTDCAVNFCKCLCEDINTTRSETACSNASSVCGGGRVSNCYLFHHCTRRRVLCLWNASRRYEKAAKEVLWDISQMPEEWKASNVTNGSFCRGLLSISRNITKATLDVNFYDTHFYTDCVEYMSLLFKKSGGFMCLAGSVPMYVCGPILFPTSPPRQIAYMPVTNGSRRLLVTVTAYYVGNFSALFVGRTRGENLQADSGVTKEFSDQMYECFRENVGIDGDFTMIHGGSNLIVRYVIGLGEADTWVGDLIKANAFNLMFRPPVWMAPAQEVLATIDNSLQLGSPIVRYTVNFDPGKGPVFTESCDAGCAAALSISAVLTVFFYAVAGVCWCRRSEPMSLSVEFSTDSCDEKVEI